MTALDLNRGNGATQDPTKPKDPEKTLGQLLGDLSGEFNDLLQTQLDLAKVELREEASKAGKTAGFFGGAAVSGYFALLLLSFAAAWGLANVMNEGWAFLIVGAVWAVVAGVLYLRARERARDVNLVPHQTVASLKEDVQWARQKLS
jgi:uncharacterized membrane protein YqjE